MSREFSIPYYRVSELTAAIGKLNRKGAKLGCEPIKVTDLGTVVRDTTDRHGKQCKMAFNRMLVEGVAPKVEGWEFLGVIEATEVGNKVRDVPGKTVPTKYRETKPECEHCRMARRRKETFVVQKGDELKQVGRQCLKDFLGHMSPEKIAEMVSWVISIEDLAGDFERDSDSWDVASGTGGGGRAVLELKEVLAVTVRLVKHYGWKSKAAAQAYNEAAEKSVKCSTADDVQTMFSRMSGNEDFKAENKPQAEDYEDAAAVAAWIEAKPGTSNYEHTLKLIAKLGYVEWKEIGVVASAGGLWAKEMGKAKEKEKVPNSEHVGEVGARIEVDVEILDKRFFDGQYGRTVMHKFADAAGNMLTWFAAGGKELGDVGEKLKIKATVKKHDEFKGTKQTLLSRAAKI